MAENIESIENSSIDVGIEATTLPKFDSKSHLNESSDELVKNVQDYLTSEINLTLEDYKLLEAMNNCTAEKYRDLTHLTQKVSKNLIDLNKKYEMMKPKLDLIDKLDKKVTRLEKMAYAIDAYSKRLEKQYRILEKGLIEEIRSTQQSSSQ
ncbi:Biogenesis of lysosome-related organelles complex 1 subunit 2 [Sarcoptes scabiei]|uniref:Biogenesis of lysosome-related organelles complex 1 subunit 2 n=1 Tax=Sarcoptes scabiei TaxID=52283 RepID=A0A834R3H2_SARSC|nr:Biogenesis of lysosome-related organelles complex 1 subunit 2 [Sarcoptes scabiei]